MTIVIIGISIVFGAAYLGITFFLGRGLARLRPAGEAQGLTFSVVIAAHNEERLIAQCLNRVCAQSIGPGRYEIILVADRCTDATVEIASRFLDAGPCLSIIEIASVPEDISPKKHAVSQAVARAKNEIVVITDADCRVQTSWLETIDRNFTPETGLVQGITAYAFDTGGLSLRDRFQALDFLSHGIVSAAAIGAGMPLNANANNLAFRRKAFDDAGGYGKVSGVISGDDDLIMQRIHRLGTWKIRYMTDSEGAVATMPSPTAQAIFEQRKRWGSKTVYYNPPQVFLLTVIFLLYLLTLLLFFAGLFQPVFLGCFAVMVTVKFAGELFLMLPGLRIFRHDHMRRFLLPASLVHLPLAVFAVLLGVFGRFTWKEVSLRRSA
jgi:cellulose synthase/poly-beta-1,6-N-acetylglucosamine synthase-like glycosyltransferase